jgi:hypothetical protein
MMMDSTLKKPDRRLAHFVERRLRSLSEKLGYNYTPTEAERIGGLKKGFIGDLLRGQKSGVHGPNVAMMAKALHVSPSELLNYQTREDCPVKLRPESQQRRMTDPELLKLIASLLDQVLAEMRATREELQSLNEAPKAERAANRQTVARAVVATRA